jgi:hypothetical protein
MQKTYQIDPKHSSTGLTLQQTEIINDLSMLLDFGGEIIQSYKFDKNLRLRKVLLVAMIAAIHNYSEGINVLLKERRTNSIEVLLRPLIETTINCSYVFATRNLDNAKKFYVGDLRDKQNEYKQVKEYLLKYPNLEVFPEIKTRDWDKDIKEHEKAIRKILGKKHKAIHGLPNLRQRAESVDLEHDKLKKKILKNRLEWWYLTIYSYMSKVTHLSPRGLDTFYKIDSFGNIQILLSGNPDNVNRTAITTYALYFNILSIFAKQFNLYKKGQFQKFIDIKKKHAKI